MCFCGLARSGSAACHACAGRGRPEALLQAAETEMTVRPPHSLSPGLTRESGWSVLDYEILQQKAHTLGTLGCAVEQALARLRAFDAGAHGTDQETRRSALLDDAADRVWALMIQRELCGLRFWEAVVKEYGIPREVLNRVGQVRRKKD